MHRSLGKNITIGLGAALFLLGVVAIVSVKSIRQFVSNNRWEDHTRQVLATIADLSAEVRDAEASGRGYVISGDERFWGPFRAASTAAEAKLQELRALTSDNAAQQRRLDRLEPLAREKFAFMDKMIVAREKQGFEPAQQLVMTAQGERLMDELVQVLGAMREEENRLLASRSAAAVTSARVTTAVISCGSALAVGLVAAAGVLIRRDMSARKRAEQELERFFTLSLDMLCIAGSDGYFKRLSPVWTRTLGFTEAELQAIPYIELVHPEDRAATEAEARTLTSGTATASFENRYRCKDGSYRWLMWSTAPAPDGKLLYATARDITARKAAERALRDAEERLRLLVESVHEYAILTLDPKGHITSWNSGAQRIKGYAAEEIVGQHFSRFYTPEDLQAEKPRRELAIATQTGRYEEEGWRLRKDGSKFWANVVISAMRDESGDLRGFSKVTRDVTERKRTEDEIRNLNAALQQHASRLEVANRELEAFSYSVSHDLRAPLRSIDGFSLALMEDYADKLEPEAKDYLQRVRAATQRMAQLIDDLLGLSRVTRSEMSRSTVDLSGMARAVAAELQTSQPERQVEFVIGDALTAEGDAPLLRVVLVNLLGNAWKFTAKRSDARIEFGTTGENGSRQFFIRDNGAGFDMTYVHKLFGAFQRLHGNGEFAGTGVGLATVQRIIHRHGGRITAEGAVDKGATFRFTL